MMKFLRGISLVCSSLLVLGVVHGKPYKRVLVISGGGLNPGFAVGIIAGVQEMGWRPDLIIATCGAGSGSSIVHSEVSIVDSFEKLRSREHFEILKRFHIDNPNGIELIQKLQEAKNTSVYPDIFENNLLKAPSQLPSVLKHNEFRSESEGPKLLVLAAKALFGPQDVGATRRYEPLFQMVYFTDSVTGSYLNGMPLPFSKSFPMTTLASETMVESSVSILNAVRGGAADPYLLNPSLIKGSYYFTGAVELYPLDIARALGDEVVATYPSALFEEYEDDAIYSAFGFKQTTRALEAIQHHDVKWIDQWGADSVSFKPDRLLFLMTSTIPKNFGEFQRAVVKQWDLGRSRAKEALAAAPGNLLDVRHHLRKPINPKLLDDFSCRNAFEWKTEHRASCLSDRTSQCDRSIAKRCTPIR